MLKLSKEDKQHIGQLLTPSWLSGLICVVAGLFVCFGVIAVFNFNDTAVQKQIITFQQSRPQKTLTTPDQILEENDKPTLKGSWTLILLWSLMGVVVYAIAVYVVHSIQSARMLQASMGYVNADKETMLVTTGEHFLIRGMAFILLISGGYLFWHRAIPYSILAARVAALNKFSIDGLLAAVLSFFVIAFGLHILTVLLRLTFARSRILST